MANPTWPNMDEAKWNLVASNVVAGTIDLLKGHYTCWGTYVLTGEAAPADTEAVRDKSPVIFQAKTQEIISANAAMDVYIWIEDANTDTDGTGITEVIQVNI
ncbi:hypothetical protein KAR91_15320 [Candidatus Pacearchaeota archaeon]|nr:hypothetical protein [Candidatus Pacearchaeota archaeon]